MASGILSGSPGPLAGGPTSDMSGMLEVGGNYYQDFKKEKCSTYRPTYTLGSLDKSIKRVNR